MSTPLTLERFRALLEAYGARSELWPEAERAAALALCDASLEARELFAAEAALDAQFADLTDPELGPHFLRRLNEVPLRAPQKQAWFSWRGLWKPALSWGLAAALGVGWGFNAPPFVDDDVDAEASVIAVESTGVAAAVATYDDDFGALAQGTLTELQE